MRNVYELGTASDDHTIPQGSLACAGKVKNCTVDLYRFSEKFFEAFESLPYTVLFSALEVWVFVDTDLVAREEAAGFIAGYFSHFEERGQQ